MTDGSTLLAAWLSTATPVLPSAFLLRWAQPAFWAVVLAFLALHLLGRTSLSRQSLAVALVAVVVWAFVPGPWSPTWWLALAFQLPSWTTVILCLWALVSRWRRQTSALVQLDAALSEKVTVTRQTPGVLAWLAIAGGALLLLDMFVVFPFALYRWGFSVFAVTALLALVAVLWLGARSDLRRREAGIAFAALALFVLTRLPTGNVFDALLDPWLWLVLCLGGARQLLSALKPRSTRG
jgi:hypothetical protein